MINGVSHNSRLMGPRDSELKAEWATVLGSTLGPAFFAQPPFRAAMKVKQSPDDFQVEELTSVVPGQRGDFAFYRLAKSNWTTPDALALIRRRWRVEPRRLSYGGLKDRHAATIQYLTIHHGPRRSLQQEGVSLTYLGQVTAAYLSRDIRANRFTLVMRHLT